MRVDGHAVGEVAAQFAPGEIYGVVAVAQLYGLLVQIYAYIVSSGFAGFKQDKLYVGCHWHHIEIAPVAGYGVEIVGEVIAPGNVEQRKERHQRFGMAEP